MRASEVVRTIFREHGLSCPADDVIRRAEEKGVRVSKGLVYTTRNRMRGGKGKIYVKGSITFLKNGEWVETVAVSAMLRQYKADQMVLYEGENGD